MNPLSIPATIAAVIDSITKRDERARAAVAPAPPPVPPRRITPAPVVAAPAPPPVVTALPRAGVGAAPAAQQPVIPAAQTQVPGGGGAVLPTQGDSLGDKIGFALGPIKDQALPAVGRAIDAPRGAVAGVFGEEAYQFVMGNRGIYTRQAETGADPFLSWALANPDIVRGAYEKGFRSRDGSEEWSGGRAVWEAYARTNAGHAAAVSLVADPINLLGGPLKRIGGAAVGQGARLAAEHNVAGRAMQLAGRAIAAPDIAYDAALRGAGKGVGAVARPVGRAAGKTRVGQSVGRWFQASPRAVATRHMNDYLNARQQRQAARERAREMGMVYDPDGVSPGVQTTPAQIVPEGITDALTGEPGGVTPNQVQSLQEASGLRTAAGHAVSEPFRAGPGVERRLVGEPDAPRFQIDAKSSGPAERAQRRYTVRAIDESGKVARGKGFDTLDEAYAFIDSVSPGPTAGSPPTGAGVGTATLEATADTVPARYELALSPKRSSRALAEERIRGRLGSYLDQLPEGTPERDEAEGILNNLITVRNEILKTTETGAKRDMRNDANRTDLWRAEFEADRAVREILDRGGVDPIFRNTQPRGGRAESLDALAWNPDETAADEARKVLAQRVTDAEANWGANNAAAESLRDAIDDAEQFRAERFGSVETEAAAAADVAEEATTTHIDAMRPEDQAAWRAGLNATNGRQTDFQAADYRLMRAHQAVETAYAGGSDEAYEAAIGQYEGAYGEALRLMEAAKRDDDYLDDLFARGTTTPPDIQAAVLGGSEQAREAFDLADRSFAPGAIEAPEVGDIFGRTFTERNAEHLGRTWGEVGDEIESRVLADRNRLLQLFARATSTLDKKELAELKRLQKEYNVNSLPEAMQLNTEDLFRERMQTQFYAEAGYTPGRAGRSLDTASRIYSSVNLLMPWAFLRYYAGNFSGDTWQVLLEHGPEAMFAANDPKHIVNMTRYALKGGDPLAGAVGDTVRRAGLGGYHPALTSMNLAETMWRNENKFLNKAAGSARFNVLGGIERATGFVTDGPRNVANGLEWAHRTGLSTHLLRQNIIIAKPQFASDMAQFAGKHGFSHDDILTTMQAMAPVVDGAEVADTFGRLALSRGLEADAAKGFSTEMGRRWASTVYRASEDALKATNDALFSYEMKNIDVFFRRVAPFHMWISRAMPFYAEQAMRHPGFAAGYYKLYKATEEQAEAQGWPPALKTFMKFWSGPGGMMMMFNPIATIGVLDVAIESNGGYTDENVSAIGRVLQNVGQYGIGLLPWWGAALNFGGYLGDSPLGLDPTGTHQARRFIGGMIQAAAGEGWLGEPALMDKPFESRLQDIRGFVSGLGLPGSFEVDVNDPTGGAAIQIRNIMLTNELKDRGMTVPQYLQLTTEAEANGEGEAALMLDEIHDTIAAEEMDGGAAYQAAVRDWSRANALGNVISAIVPGPKRTRQETGLEIQTTANTFFAEEDGDQPILPGVGPLPEGDPARRLRELGVRPRLAAEGVIPANVAELVDPRDLEFMQKWADRFGTEYRAGDIKRMQEAALRDNTAQNAPPESAAILEQQAQYYSLGTENERALLEGYYDILFARNDLKLRRHGAEMAQEDLAALDDVTRSDLADAWLADVDPSGEMQRLVELRQLFEGAHPEFAAYQEWASGTRKQWGTVAAFRLAAARSNENYRDYIEREARKLRAKGLPTSEINAKLDERALSLDGYLAYMGMRKSRYDPAPKPTGAPLPVASEGATGEGFGGGGGSYQSWGERVRNAIRDTHEAMKASKAFLGVRLDELPSDFREAALADPNYPAEAMPPDDQWIYDQYKAFYFEQQAAGGDTSIDAFIASTQREGDQPSQFEAGTWPPVAVAP